MGWTYLCVGGPADYRTQFSNRYVTLCYNTYLSMMDTLSHSLLYLNILDFLHAPFKHFILESFPSSFFTFNVGKFRIYSLFFGPGT
jgi:hypothetical protein